MMASTLWTLVLAANLHGRTLGPAPVYRFTSAGACTRAGERILRLSDALLVACVEVRA